MRARGADTEEILAFLREKGLYKLQSIKVLRVIYGISLGEAKERVHLSRTWSDVRESDDELHELAEREVDTSAGSKRAAHVSMNA